MSDIQAKVDMLNALHKEIQACKAEQPNHKLGYYPGSLGSLLNAYREGDIGFDECIELLRKAQAGACNHQYEFRFCPDCGERLREGD